MRARFKGTSRKLTLREPCACKLPGTQLVTFRAVTSIAAIPPPSPYVRGSAPSGMAKLRQMLESDAIAVRPIQAIPDESRRLRDPNLASAAESSEEGIYRSRGTSGDEVRSRPLDRRSGTDAPRVEGGFQPDGAAPPASLPRPQAAASPSTGFLTQSIAQEAMGSGLHIEPWRAAIGAYRRAGASLRESLVSNISV